MRRSRCSPPTLVDVHDAWRGQHEALGVSYDRVIKVGFGVAAVRRRASEQLAVIINDNEPPRAGRFEKKSAPRPWSPYAGFWRPRTPMLGPEGRGSIKISIREAIQYAYATCSTRAYAQRAKGSVWTLQICAILVPSRDQGQDPCRARAGRAELRRAGQGVIQSIRTTAGARRCRGEAQRRGARFRDGRHSPGAGKGLKKSVPLRSRSSQYSRSDRVTM